MRREGAEQMSADVVFRAFPVPALPLHEARRSDARRSDARAAEPVRLDQAEEQRAAALEPASSARFRAGRIALRQFAAELMDVPVSGLAADYFCPQCAAAGDKAHGRPGYSLNGRTVPLLLSLSRAGGWILLAGLPKPDAGVHLGVDVEDPATAGFAGFDATVLTAAEAAMVAGARREARNQIRARLWARKEAWLKMQGSGLRTDPAAVDVLSLPGLRDLAPEEAGLPRYLAAAVAVG